MAAGWFKTRPAGLLPAILLGCLPLTSWADCVKTVRWYDDVPYAFKGTDGQAAGLTVELASAALKAMGCEAKFVEMPWARALLELQTGRLDILPGALKTPEREQFAYFSRPFNRSPNVLFISTRAAPKYQLKSLSDIVGTQFKLGAQIGVAYGPEYNRLIKLPEFRSRITTITSRRNAWKMMELRRVDGIIADEVSALTELKQLGLLGTVIRSEVIVSDEAAAFALGKASNTADFVVNFDKALNGLIADGSYKSIAERHLPCSISVEKLGCK
jgi:polar amino acid transport system substrate-binding protein